MPLTVGGGVRTVERHPQAAAGRRRQGVDQHRRRAATAHSSREAAEKFGGQCIVVAIDAKTVSRPGEATAGRSSPMAGATPTGLDAVDYAREVVATRRRRDPADLDGSRRHQGTASIWRSPAPSPTRSGAGHRLRRRRHARPSRRRRARGPCQRGAGRLDLPFRRHSRSREAKERLAAAGRCRVDRMAADERFTLEDLDEFLAPARHAPRRTRSYTAKLLLDAGRPTRAKKLGEEAVEAVIAAVRGRRAGADRWKRPMCSIISWSCFAPRGIALQDVMRELERRTGRSGLAEKAARRTVETPAPRPRHAGSRGQERPHGHARASDRRPTTLALSRLHPRRMGGACAPTRR